MVHCLRNKGEFITPRHQALPPIKHTLTIQTEVEDYANSTRPSVQINLPLRCEILLFADLHEFRGEPVGLKGQRSLSCLYRVWNDRTKVCQEHRAGHKQRFLLVLAHFLRGKCRRFAA